MYSNISGETRKYRGSNKRIIPFILLILLSVTVVIVNVIVEETEVYAKSNLEDIENELKKNVDDSLDGLDLGELEEFVNNLEGDSLGHGLKDFVRGLIKGEYKAGYSDYFKLAFRSLLGGVTDILPIILTVVAIAILFSIINNLSSGFIGKSTTEIIYFVCYSAIIVLIAVKVGVIAKEASDTIKNIEKLLQLIFPVLLTLMTALGGAVSVSVYQPLMAVLSTGIIGIINSIIVPCFIATMALTIVGNLTKTIKLDKLNKFFKSVGETVLGIVFSLFTSFVAIQGITGSVTDSISFRSAKFAISSYVPILGGYLSDGFDLVMASLVLIKNSIGVTGVMLLLSIVLAPIMKILCFSLALKLTAGIIEPIGEKRMSDIVYGISKNMTLLTVALIGVSFMFFIMMMLVTYSLNLGV